MTTKLRTSTAIRFPTEMHEALRIAAEERDLSINFLVIYAVRDLLDHLLPADDMRLTDPNLYSVKPWPSKQPAEADQ